MTRSRIAVREGIVEQVAAKLPLYNSKSKGQCRLSLAEGLKANQFKIITKLNRRNRNQSVERARRDEPAILKLLRIERQANPFMPEYPLLIAKMPVCYQ